ncbi:MAG: FG-GAP-like repeat-containing protein [Pannonibacter sp.]
MSLRIKPATSNTTQYSYNIKDTSIIVGIAFGDINGDGRDDFVVHGGAFPGRSENIPQSSYTFVQELNGYTPKIIPDHKMILNRPTVLGDFNGDGLIDLFIAGSGWDADPFPGERNYLFLNSKDGYVNATEKLPNFIDYAHGAGAADIDGDGDLDIIVNALVGEAVKVAPYALINDGLGNFTADWSRMPSSTQPSESHNGYPNQRWSWMEVGDLDGDGLGDLIAGKWNDFFNTPESVIFFNNGGSFSDFRTSILPNHPDFGSNAAVVGTLVEDFNGDGSKDIVMLSYRLDPYAVGWSIQLLQNDGRGNFKDVSRDAFEGKISSGLRTPWPGNIRAADINNDGFIDIVAESPSGAYAPDREWPLAWLGNGKGKFTPLLAGDVLADHELGMLYNSSLIWTGETMKLVGVSAWNGEIVIREKVFSTIPQVAYAATNSNDVFRGTTAADSVDGLGGVDTFILSTARSETNITRSGNSINISHGNTVDQLTNIEIVQFTDGLLRLDVAAGEIAGQTYRLYQAAFARIPDTPGLAHNINLIDGGLTLKDMSNAFISSAEFKQKYGENPSDTSYINALYNNVLGRDADAAGLAGWQQRLADRSWDRADVLIGFSESAENQTLVGTAIGNGIWLGS